MDFLENMDLGLNIFSHGIYCEVQVVQKNEVIHFLIHSNKSHFEIVFMNFPSKFTNFQEWPNLLALLYVLCLPLKNLI